MPNGMPVQITMYLSESDKWHGRPLHVALLNFLREENVFAATVFHAVGGFFGRQRVKSSHLVDAGGKLPVVLTFVDQEEHVNRVLPKLKEMAPTHLIVRENVTIEQGSLD
jgi:PII-like signaling protein